MWSLFRSVDESPTLTEESKRPYYEPLLSEEVQKAVLRMKKSRNVDAMNVLDSPKTRHMMPRLDEGRVSLDNVIALVQRSDQFLRIRQRHFPEEFRDPVHNGVLWSLWTSAFGSPMPPPPLFEQWDP